MPKVLRALASSFASGVRYRLHGRRLPTFLVYQFTGACNSRCTMCSIWKQPAQPELGVAQIADAFCQPVFSQLRWVNLTGGEPFLRNDFAAAASAVAKLPAVEGIAVPTNGFLTEKVLKDTGDVLKSLRKGQFLSVTVSIDGFEKTHDRIRGVKGAYSRAIATLEGLQKIGDRRLSVGVQPTISSQNIGEIGRFHAFIKRKSGKVGYAVMMQSEGYYSNRESSAGLFRAQKKKAGRFLLSLIRDYPEYGFYYSNLARMFEGKKRGFGCLAGRLTLFMDPAGRLSVCPVLSASPGYSLGTPWNTGWFSREQVLGRLAKEKTCRDCTLLCDMVNAAKVEFFEIAGYLLSHPFVAARLIGRAGRLRYL